MKGLIFEGIKMARVTPKESWDGHASAPWVWIRISLRPNNFAKKQLRAE